MPPKGTLTKPQIVARNKAHVSAIRARTVCELCGNQPIDWHRDIHVQHPSWRVSMMAGNPASIERIDEEIAACQALCRKCHMAVDGRARRLAEAGEMARQRVMQRPVKMCLRCGKPARPSRRGLCSTCYSRERRALTI